MSTNLNPASIPKSSTRTKPRRESTTDQTAKKRELDRIAQKRSRERVRNRIAELEEKLERLQSDDKQKQITDLMRLVDVLKAENESLREMVQKIRGLVNEPEGSEGSGVNFNNSHIRRRSPTSSHHSEQTQQHVLSEVPYLQNVPNPWDNGTGSESPEEMKMDDYTCRPSLVSASEADPTPRIDDNSLTDLSTKFKLPLFNSLSAFQTSLACGTPGQPYLEPNSSTVVPDIDKWHTSNSAFIFGIDAGKRSPFESDIVSSSAAYKAILWGNENVEAKEREHPFWLALRQVDERVFGNWTSKAQKIAMMFVSHRMLLYQSNPCKENFERIPTFMRPRPSQETTQHPAVIDFLIWPGLRDRLVFSHKHYTSTGDFSKAFCENLHFHWPFSDDDILILDEATGEHKLSPLFERYAFDLKNWTMNDGFFERFVEMKYDIPVTRCENGLERLFDYMPMTA